MDWRRHIDEVDAQLQESTRLYRLKHFLDALMVPVLVVLMVVLYAEFFADLSVAQHEAVLFTQKLLLGYFLLELGVDLVIYEERKQFFRDRWVDIVLVLPFFSLFRTTGQVFQSLKGAKLLKPAKGTKAAKAAKGGKALKGAKTAKPIKAPKAVKGLKGTQKVGKIITKSRHVLEDVREYI